MLPTLYTCVLNYIIACNTSWSMFRKWVISPDERELMLFWEQNLCEPVMNHTQIITKHCSTYVYYSISSENISTDTAYLLGNRDRVNSYSLLICVHSNKLTIQIPFTNVSIRLDILKCLNAYKMLYVRVYTCTCTSKFLMICTQLVNGHHCMWELYVVIGWTDRKNCHLLVETRLELLLKSLS